MAQVWLGKPCVIRRLGFALAAAVTGLILSLFWIGPGFLVRLENASLDFRFKLRGTHPAGDEVVLVVVDEKSLKEIGRWPWSRDKQARLVDAIAADGAKVIGLDIIYAEPEVSEYLHGLREVAAAAEAGGASPGLLQTLRGKLENADADRQFTGSLRAAETVVLALSFVVPETGTSESAEPPAVAAPLYIKRGEFMLVRQSRSGEALEPLRATDVHPPLASFADAAVALGHVYSLPDPDGITRYEYLAIRYDDGYYPSFGLEVARLYLGLSRERMSLTLGEGVRLGDGLVPADQKARMLVNYAGRERSFRYVSATDVLQSRVPPGTFAGRAVLVGTAALGTYDQKTTPFSANFPGVEKNATVVENIIHNRFLEKNVWSGPIDASMILLFGLGLGYVLPKMRALPGAIMAASALTGYAAVAQYLFVVQGVWLDIVAPISTIAMVFVSVTVLHFMTEEKQAKEVRAMFSSYVSPVIVEELIKDPGKAVLGGQRKELTMLFSDIAGFTAFSEKRSAEDVVAQLNEYLGAMTDVVFRWNGTLDKFVGDAIVVFWGAPLDQPDHVELAIKCALHMRSRLKELQNKWKAEGRDPLDNGIGINTGEVVVGNIGAAGKKMDYTMIGDHVNLAARAQALSRQFDCPIVVTEHTAVRLKALMQGEERADNKGRLGHVTLRKLGLVKVKGKDQPVVVYGLHSLGRQEQSRVEEQASMEVGGMTDQG